MKKRKRILGITAAIALTLSLAACSGAGQQGADGIDKKTIAVGSSNFTEAMILGNIYSELIESNTQYTVEQNFGLAGASVCFSALENGDIDMFVEYTGTALMNLLQQPMDTDKDNVYQAVHDRMKDDHNIFTSQPLGFNNTYVMSVKPAVAEAYGLSTLSGLIEKSADLRLGCTVEFIQREDCLPLLESKYDAKFKDVSGLDASLRYHAIEAAMAAMNAQVDVDGMDAADVAHQFLVERGLIQK